MFDTNLQSATESGISPRPIRRVCLLTTRFPPDEGGVAVSVLRNAGLLAGTGAQVHVSVLDQRLAEGSTREESHGQIAVHRVGGKASTSGVQNWHAEIVRLHRRYRFDLLHGFYLVPAGFLATVAGRLLGLPSVVSARGNDVDLLMFDAERFGQLYWTMLHATAVTTVSRELLEKVLALAPGCKVHYVPNSVDADVFYPATGDPSLLTKYGLTQRPTLLFSGEARRKKGLAVLLQAFALLPDSILCNLIMAGGVRPDDRPTLDRFLTKHPDLGPRLRILPYLPTPNLIDLYHLADIVLLPSLQDGMPNSLLEAMACGRPVIASVVGGIADVVSDGVDGFLLPPGDPQMLSTAIIRLMTMPQDRARAGERARRTIEARYRPKNELERNLAIYQQILSQPPA